MATGGKKERLNIIYESIDKFIRSCLQTELGAKVVVVGQDAQREQVSKSRFTNFMFVTHLLPINFAYFIVC